MARHTHILLNSLCMILLSASFALAASVTVVSTGNGAYAVQGDSITGVSGIQLDIAYDSAALATPTVTQGELVTGAMLAANTTVPGTIRIAIISTTPFAGSGQIASISFATHSGSGGITSVKSSMIDKNGASVASFASVAGDTPSNGGGLSITAGVPFSQPGSTTPASITNTTTPASTTAASIPTYLGTVTMPTDTQGKIDAKPSGPLANIPVQPVETPADKPVQPIVEEKVVPEVKKVAATATRYKSILDSFRTYKGTKSAESLIALFDNRITPNIQQEPAIAVSNGTSSVTIVATVEGSGDTSPNFALSGAKLVSLTRDDVAGKWTIVALPNKGAMYSTLMILTASNTIEYPLTVTPLAASVSSHMEDFNAFLADARAAKPKRDLNDDGKHDYLDDYIYTANYLVKRNAEATTPRK